MKLLYCAVVLGLIQYGLTAVAIAPPRQQQQLYQFYNQEMEKLAKEHFANVKQLLEKLLQDDTIKQGSTPTFQNFKEKANQFLQQYPNVSRMDPQTIFSDVVNFTFLSSGIEIVENAFEVLAIKFVKSYESMIKEKFIPKFEESKKQMTPKELEQQQNYMEWFEDFKRCSKYLCYAIYLMSYP